MHVYDILVRELVYSSIMKCMCVRLQKINFGKLKLTFVTFFPMIYARKTLPNDMCLVDIMKTI